MPNYCANTLKMTAATPAAAAMLETIRAELQKEEPQIFETIYPTPRKLMETRAGFPQDPREDDNLKKYGARHWYDWRVKNWGTKWDAVEPSAARDAADTIMMTFDTAWAPPVGIYQFMHAVGFEIEATYCEQGCDFIGYWKDGQDHTDTLSEVAPQTEDGYNDEDAFSLSDYFAAYGIDHSPAHFGG